MGRQLPTSVRNATWVALGLVAMSGLTAVLTVVLRDDLVRSWANRHETAKVLLADGGMAALERSSITPPAFVPVAIVSFFVFAALAGVLLVLFREGFGWARVALTGMAAFAMLTTIIGFRQHPPSLFLVLSAVTLVLDAGLLFFLWHRETSAFLRGAWTPSERAS